MKYNIDDILTFANVAKTKSFTKAAALENISRSMVTLRVSRLEKSLKIPLLVRNTREVHLTNDGKKFFEYCDSIIQKINNLDDFLDAHHGISGVLKIVLPPYFSRYHIVPYLNEFLTKYPKLTLEIALTENPVNIIAQGYDLQIRIQIPEEEDLETAKIASNSKLVCASPQYLNKHMSIAAPRDLLDHNCIIFGENNVWKFKHKKTGEIIEMRDMKGNLKCDNGEIIKELVLAGVGVTLKSSCDVTNELKSGDLIQLLTDYEVMNKTQFYAVYPSERANVPKIKAFVEFFRGKLSELA